MMLTKEQRDGISYYWKAIFARGFNIQFRELPTEVQDVITTAGVDIPVLLDALVEAEADLAAMTRRAEALERAIKSSDFMPELDFACQTCAHPECPDGECCAADNRHRSWQFDEARFAGEDGVWA